MTTPLPEPLTIVPDIPKEFGDDGGQFYRYYDELAEEIDEDLVKSLKVQLDGILIFAGLFAGVNSAFLALTLPQMNADPTNDTNALLLQIALGRNSSITSAADLPSASFIPPPGIYPINVLFSVSLTLALLSSFLAVLGQQWLVYYRKRGGGGPEHQRWEQLRRYLGAKRWRLELVLNDVVPSLLQLGLVIFFIAFTLYLNTLSHSLNRIIASLLCIAAATVLALSTSAAFDPWCPFKVPWSRIVRLMACASVAVATWLGACCTATGVFVARSITVAAQRTILIFEPPNPEAEERLRGIWFSDVREFAEAYTTGPAKAYRELSSGATRSAESPDDLQIIALKRVMCTSEDCNALIYSAVNLQVIRDQKALSSLAKDAEFCNRLSDLHQAALDAKRQGLTGSRDSSREAKVFSASFSHLLISTGSIPFFGWSGYGTDPSQIIDLESLGISSHQIRDLNQGNSIPSTCDRCSHCPSLQFCMKVVHLIAEGVSDLAPTNFSDAYRDVVGRLDHPDALRLGCVVASVILCSKEWCDVCPSGFTNWPRSTLIQKLFNAYRTKSELEMVQTISAALTTARTQWGSKPDHEIYVGLFELCLLPGRKVILTADYHAVLGDIDAHLISIERLVRNKDTSKTDRQNGREQQNRCIRAAADFFGAQKSSSRAMWAVIGAALERYLESVTKLRKANPGHSENATLADVLGRIQSSFPEPEPVGAVANATGGGSEEDQERTVYIKVHRLLGKLI
ncbi:hypothetical protein FRC01_002408 [Tulasnella sp. 417]|nr:hypothetical protein FRC01_002408 [Tulasnella sp. 417]